jgi:uncharacterized protein (TIGR02285 family)
MNISRCCYQLIIFYFLLLPLSAEEIADNVIFWQSDHRPPGIFTQGEHSGQGFVQKALQEVTERLPQYSHVMVTSSLARALRDIQNKKQVCHPALFKTLKRQAFAEFSRPVIVHPTNRVVMRKSLANRLFPENTLSIELMPVLENQSLTFALIDGRLFGANIDKLMATTDLGDRLVSIPSENLGNMLNMVSLGRTDLTIAYPFEIEHFNLNLPDQYEPLTTYIIESVPAYSMGYIACPGNVWGRKVIDDINVVLERIRAQPAYREAVTTWWRKEASAQNFTQYYEQVFLKN